MFVHQKTSLLIIKVLDISFFLELAKQTLLFTSNLTGSSYFVVMNVIGVVRRLRK